MEIWFCTLETARAEWKELLLSVMAVRRKRNKRDEGKEKIFEPSSTFRTQALAPFSPFLLLPFFSITMPDSKSTFHPALVVSNIKNHVSIILEMENDGKQKAPPTEEETELWLTLDATVLQWIYATISHDLLHTILEPDTTTMEAWNSLRDI
ncbi:hypothetical protein GmHk_02G005480 [Glycine max]|nr:hypothetical protein GmHk_02G005480 [Glycine max]